MNNLRTIASQRLALAAAITLAVAGVTAATMPAPTAAPTAEPSGDTAPDLGLTPTAYNGFCTLVGAVPGGPPQQNCRRIPVTVTASHDTTTAEAAR